MDKSFLFLCARAPLESAPEAFDLAMTAAAFDHEVLLVLVDDGVFWLQSGLPGLVRDAVEQIAAEQESLAERGLGAPPPGVLAIDRAALAARIAEADVVVGG